MTDDVQGVDELSRKWMRGRSDFDAYTKQFGPMLSEISSTFSDFKETQIGDMGFVTSWLEQDYKVQGEATHFSGPVTMVMRREGNEWRIALVHAVPMPER